MCLRRGLVQCVYDFTVFSRAKQGHECESNGPTQDAHLDYRENGTPFSTCKEHCLSRFQGSGFGVRASKAFTVRGPGCWVYCFQAVVGLRV